MQDILKYNQSFVAKKEYSSFQTSKYPDKKLAIVTCMDTRLTELLPAALGLKNGDAKIIKNAGGVITNPFGSAVRSLVVAIYELGVEEIAIIGHTDCGVQHMDADAVIGKMKERRISEETLGMAECFGIDLNRWLRGFECVNESVKHSVKVIRNHPLIPKDVKVHGYIMDSNTGKLTVLE